MAIVKHRKITEQLIQYELSKYFNPMQNIIVPNIDMYWFSMKYKQHPTWYGNWGYEADLLVIRKSKYVEEVEIKLTKSDFLNDFKKRHLHNADIVSKLWYCLPEGLVEYATPIIEEKYDYRVGIFGFNHLGVLYPRRHPNFRNKNKIDERGLEHIARITALKLWNMRKI